MNRLSGIKEALMHIIAQQDNEEFVVPILRVYASKSFDTEVVIVMKNMDCHDLIEILKGSGAWTKHWQSEFILGLKPIEVMKKAIQALNSVHQRRVLHGDIKPENLLLSRTTGNVMIIDFGNAHFIESENSKSKRCNTHCLHASPEVVKTYMKQFRNQERIKACEDPTVQEMYSVSFGHRRIADTFTMETEWECEPLGYSFEADVYSLGVTFLTLFRAKDPYPKSSLMLSLAKHPTMFALCLVEFQIIHDNEEEWQKLDNLLAQCENGTTYSFLDIVTPMLNLNVFERPSASEMLMHPLLQVY